MISITIEELKPGMEILVSNTIGSPNTKVLTKHTVSHTSLGHPGKLTVYCNNGFRFDESDVIYLNDAINQTHLLLKGTNSIDFDEI